ncbi:hypothetical protein VTO42DRAFT_4360 [Malbranchea cinnamomea]
MGIAGLHQLLKSIQKPCHLKKFKGQTLGVDAYGWLHRGTVACAIDLALGQDTKKYVDFFMNRVSMLIYFGVTPYIVFDGGVLPSKAATEEARAARREESKRAGMRLYHAGRVVQAQQELQKAVDVTPYMARMVIEELKKLDIQYLVAPYEADAQLVYLEKQGIINGIISEDSDMLVFGAKRLISKLDQHGECVELNRSDFTTCRDISLIGWTDENFRQMCILSGCDYLASIPGMGLKTAYRYIRKCKSVDRAVKMVRFDGKSRVPDNYLEDFKRAELTFLHQRVFCPKAQKLVTLTPLPADAKEEDMPFIGESLSPEIAIGIACGDLDPVTKEPIVIKQSYPERQRMVLGRRQTMPSTTEKRPTPRITSFFTPKRIPLGELDPNSLTPSPSQQQVLEENANRSWDARPAPTTSSRVRRSLPSSFFTPRTLVTPRSSQFTDSQRENLLARAPSTSGPQPVKRPRLCSDIDGDESTPTMKSRFFATSKPSLKGGIKQAKKATFGVFSDDSVEDIMTQLPDNVASISATPATPGSELPSQQSTAQTAPLPVSEVEKATATVSFSPAAATPAAAAPVELPEPSTTETGTSTVVELPNLKSYGYTPSEQSLEPSHPCKAAPVLATAGLKRSAPLEECQPPAHVRRTTPLQRLGQAALSRSKSLTSLDALRKLSAAASTNESGYDSDCTARSSVPAIKGSEDLIVPDSQDEDDPPDATTEEPQQAKLGVFDVRRFMFAPP